MKLRNILSIIIVFILFVFACSSDDDGTNFTPVSDRDRTEQQATDKAILLEYLDTHYYNSGELTNIINPQVNDIVIDSLESTLPPNSTLLSDAVEVRTTTFEDTEYEYYILKINQGGGGASPNFCDDVRVSYEGNLVADGSLFDSQVIFTTDLLSLIIGWQRVFPEFNTASTFTTGSNVEYNDYGLGVMFLPSGLAYYSQARLGIPSYSNLVFKFALFQSEENDHDEDGIPSYIEDLNNNLNLSDENTDEDNASNFADFDDDGDGVLTINELQRTEYVVDTNNGELEPSLEVNEFELSRNEESGVITIITGKIVDLNDNGVPDYLDEEATDDLSLDN